jgi:CheY-like chemotaxis protein
MGVPAPREDLAPRNLNRRCVLVVDDDPDSLRATVRLLELNGYAAHGATGFQEALDVWTNSGGCDILIADIALPDGSGLDLMRRLGSSGVRGVSVSGHVDPAHRKASRDAGFVAHFVKPVRFEDLLAAVARMV